MTDKKTTHLGLPLPDADNALAEDCPRLAEALSALDSHAGAVDSQMADVQTRLQPLDSQKMYAVLDAKARTLETTESGELSVSIQLVESMITAAVLERSKREHPVGSYYTSDQDTDPSKIFGFGTWERVKGVVLLGADEDSYPAGSEGGEAEHTLTVEEMPSHSHQYNRLPQMFANTDFSKDDQANFNSSVRASSNTEFMQTWDTGGNQPHNNMMPYHAAYCWRRTA